MGGINNLTRWDHDLPDGWQESLAGCDEALARIRVKFVALNTTDGPRNQRWHDAAEALILARAQVKERKRVLADDARGRENETLINVLREHVGEEVFRSCLTIARERSAQFKQRHAAGLVGSAITVVGNAGGMKERSA